jgi:DNA polymerase
VIAVGWRVGRLYPIFHPAAALYTPRMLETLREDFLKLPALLAMQAPEQAAELGGSEEPMDGMSRQQGGEDSPQAPQQAQPGERALLGSGEAQLGLF